VSRARGQPDRVHNWERRAPSDRALSDAWLTEKISQIHEQSRGVYGAPRIHAQLGMEHGIRVGRKRVARLMKVAGITGIRPRKRWSTTIRIPGITPASDLVERQFRPDAPNVLWVADIVRHEALLDRAEVKGLRLGLVAASRLKLRAA
jgi:putative transposase